MKKFLLVLICGLVLAADSRCHAEDWGWRVGRTAVDLFIARPFTLAATGVGAVIWGVTLPITMPIKVHKDAYETMVVEPWQYTVDRPLGEFED